MCGKVASQAAVRRAEWRYMRLIAAVIAAAVILSGCVADQSSLSAEPAPTLCAPEQVRLIAGRSGAAAGTMYLTFRAELVEAPPCLVLTWPSVAVSDGSGAVIARGTGSPTADPRTTLLAGFLEFHLGWASWCGPEPSRPLTASVGLLEEEHLGLAIPNGFGPSGCMGSATIVFVEPGW